MSSLPQGELLTLEPLIEAVREGVEGAGWELSGLQKTTSHQFEGRWDGDSTRSAYLFFHSDAQPDFVSIDVYLDETTRGLTGNLALVVDLRSLGELGDPRTIVEELAAIAGEHLDAGLRRPLTYRARMKDASGEVDEADCEVRFKVRFPKSVLNAGHAAAAGLCAEVVAAYEGVLRAPRLADFTPSD